MKLPKELQKKKTANSRQLTENRAVREMVKSFKLEFLRVKEKFKDKREVKFMKIEDKGRFSILIPLYRDERNPAMCFWTESFIEIYFGMGAISNFFKYYNFNLEQYKKMLREIAWHEYGHIISINTSYDIYPKQIASMIKSGSYTFNEIEAEVDYSKEEEINQSLTQVNVLTIGRAFREFLANYMVFKQITKKIPSMLLIAHGIGIVSHLRSLRRGFINPSHQSYDKLFLLLELSSNHFIHDKWDILTNEVKKYRIEKIFEFIYHASSNFQKIINNFSEYKNQIDIVHELAPLLDQIDYKDMVLNNTLDIHSIKLLCNFN